MRNQVPMTYFETTLLRAYRITLKMSGDGHSSEILQSFIHTFLRHISKKRSLDIQNFSLLRNPHLD